MLLFKARAEFFKLQNKNVNLFFCNNKRRQKPNYPLPCLPDNNTALQKFFYQIVNIVCALNANHKPFPPYFPNIRMVMQCFFKRYEQILAYFLNMAQKRFLSYLF